MRSLRVSFYGPSAPGWIRTTVASFGNSLPESAGGGMLRLGARDTRPRRRAYIPAHRVGPVRRLARPPLPARLPGALPPHGEHGRRVMAAPVTRRPERDSNSRSRFCRPCRPQDIGPARSFSRRKTLSTGGPGTWSGSGESNPEVQLGRLMGDLRPTTRKHGSSGRASSTTRRPRRTHPARRNRRACLRGRCR